MSDAIDLHALAQQLSNLSSAYREKAETLEAASQAVTVIAETKEFQLEREGALASARTLLGESEKLAALLSGIHGATSGARSPRRLGFAQPRRPMTPPDAE